MLVRGQELAVEQLEHFLKTKSPPTLLFLGPEGVGKFTSAVRFASRLADIPVARIENGNSVDVRVHDGISLKVDEARELERQLRWRPVAAKVRVSIVDNAERMSAPVYNALLKILEEPPPTSYIVLVSSSVDAVPLTVKSRCHLIHFGMLTEEDVVRILIEDLNMAEDSAKTIASMSEGSMKKAMWGYKGFFKEDLALISGIVTSIRAGNIESVLIEIDRWTNRDEALRRLYIMYLYFRDCFIIGTDRLFVLPQRPISQTDSMKACSRIERAHAAISKNANLKLILVNLSLDLTGIFA